MKKTIALILVLVLLLSLGGCASEKNVEGLWKRETIYLEYYGCDADMYIFFADDGKYYEVLLEHGTDDFLNFEYGEWEIEGGKVVATEEGEDGTTEYSYLFGTMKNGDNKYEKLDSDHDMYELFEELFNL